MQKPLYESTNLKKHPLVLNTFNGVTHAQYIPANSGGNFTQTIWYGNRHRKRPVGELNLFQFGTTFKLSRQDWTDAVALTPWGPNGYYEKSVILSDGKVVMNLIGSEWLNPSSFIHQGLDELRQQHINLGMMLAEYRQTADMMSTLGRRLVTALGTHSKARRFVLRHEILGTKRYSALSKRFSDEWLMYQYGLYPLYKDIQGVAAQMANPLVSNPIYKIVKMKGKPSPHYVKREEQIDTNLKRTGSRSVNHRASVLIRFSEEPFKQSLSRIGLLNAPTLLWEASPYSFLVDWVFTVGPSLASLDNPYFFGSTVDVQMNQKAKLRYEITYYGAKATCDRTELERRTAATQSVLQPLRYEPHISAQRLLSAVSLMRQRIPQKYFTTR